ncbi:MAG: oxygen-independent coproporphyrinogen III oxidase [Flavobacteriales bacterium]|nr:oxygen-independent coproporphyrinogen III oxidase [Flavobacteriales bacterium]
MQSLISKYNIPGPRYTSYPTVPYWDEAGIQYNSWIESVKKSYRESNQDEGISLYIHLPFCESLCTFCGCNKRITKNHNVENPYINAVLKEWDLYLELFEEKPIIRELHLGGGTPTFFKPESLNLLLEGILSKGIIPKNHSYSFEGHPNNTTKAHLEIMNKHGFERASYGVQDLDFKVQKTINRIQPFANVKRVTEDSRSTGYDSISFDLVYGLPHQTIDSVAHTIEKVKELMPERIAFYSYAHVPWIKGNGQRGFDENDLPSADEKRTLYETGYELLLKAGYKEIGMDHFALEHDSMYQAMKQKMLHRNFMGYTASKTQLMIGLGVSSISDSWYAFAQNVKTVEEYYEVLDLNKIPIFKGHELNDEDLIIRKHILDIMCHYETEWNSKDKQHQSVLDALPRLHEIEADGFIEISHNRLTVTEKGKPFVRNICMAFDAKLMRNKPSTQLFSMTI